MHCCIPSHLRTRGLRQVCNGLHVDLNAGLSDNVAARLPLLGLYAASQVRTDNTPDLPSVVLQV